MSNGATQKTKARGVVKSIEKADEGGRKELIAMIVANRLASREEEEAREEEREITDEQMEQELKLVHRGEGGLQRDMGAIRGPAREELNSLCAQLETALDTHRQGQTDQADKINELKSRIVGVEDRISTSTAEVRGGRAEIEAERAGATPKVSTTSEVEKKEPGFLERIRSRVTGTPARETEVTTTRTEITKTPGATSVAGKEIDTSARIIEQETASAATKVDAEVETPLEEARTLARQLKAAEDGGDSQTAARLSRDLGKIMEEHHLSPESLKGEMSTAETTRSHREIEEPPATEESGKTPISSEVTRVEASKYDLQRESKVGAHLRERAVAGERVLEGVAAQEGVIAEMDLSHQKLEEAYSSAITKAKELIEYMRANPGNKDIENLQADISKIADEYGLTDEKDILQAGAVVAEIDGVELQTKEGGISPMVKEDVELCAKIANELKASGMDVSPLQVVGAAKSIIDDKEHPAEHLHEVLVKSLFQEHIKEMFSAHVAEYDEEQRKAA